MTCTLPQLQSFIDPGSLKATAHTEPDDNGQTITSWKFTVNGGVCTAQTDSTNIGFYAFRSEPSELAVIAGREMETETTNES